jgi:hypothetical protein
MNKAGPAGAKKSPGKPGILFCAALLAFLTSGTGCLLTTRGFITQPGGGNNQCGAFSAAYYQWLKAGKTQSGDKGVDKAEVDAIYDEIQFGSAFARALGPYGIPLDYSDPLKIMKFLGAGNTGAAGTLYRKPGDPLLDSLYTLIGSIEPDDFNAARKEDAALPELDAEHPYAIVLCKTQNNRSLHYMLFARQESGGLVYYDPYAGAPATASHAMMIGQTPINKTWISSGSGILLP